MCGRKFTDGRTVCPDDGAPLISMGGATARRSSGSVPQRPVPPMPASGPRPVQRPRAASGALPPIRNPNSASMIGTTVGGRFVIEEKIGSGGMGVVYRARQLLIDRAVALKILPRDLADDDDAAKRFANEAKAISLLRHPNVVTLYDFGFTDDGRPFIAMEFLNGPTLTEFIKQGPMPHKQAASIARQVAMALQAAHDLGIIHRDIKPDNVMIERRPQGADQVRVLDFGIARNVETDQRLTQTGIVFATPQYCSPEQALGLPLDHRSDLYSLGVLYFEMLAGRLPFIEKIGPLLLHKHINERPPRLTEVAGDIDFPDGLEALVDQMLAKEPEQRPESCRAFIEALDAIEARAGVAISGASARAPVTAASAESQLSPENSAPEGHLGERDAEMPPFHPARGHRLSLWLALVIGTTAVASGLFFLLKPESDAMSGVRGVPATRSPTLAPSGQSAPATSIASTPPVPMTRPGVPDARLLGGLRGYLLPPPIPPWLTSENPDAPELPMEGVALPPAEVEPATHAQALRAQLEALPPDAPDSGRLLLEIANALWVQANREYATLHAAYDTAEASYIQTDLQTERALPKVPTPIYDAARVPLEAWLAAHPKDVATPQVLYYSGVSHLSAARRDDGMERLRRLVAEYPLSPFAGRARRPIGDHLFFDERKPAEARTTYAARVSDAPPREQLYLRFMLGYASYNAGAYSEAADAFQVFCRELGKDVPGADVYLPAALDALALTFVRIPKGEDRAAAYFGGFGGRAMTVKVLRLMAQLLEAQGEAQRAQGIYALLMRDVETSTPEEFAELLREAASIDHRRGSPAGALALYDQHLNPERSATLPPAVRLLLSARRAAMQIAKGDVVQGEAALDQVLAEGAPLETSGSAVIQEAMATARLHKLDSSLTELRSFSVARASESEQQATELLRDLQVREALLLTRYDDVVKSSLGASPAASLVRKGDVSLAVASRLAEIYARPPTELNDRALAQFRLKVKGELERALGAARNAYEDGRRQSQGSAIATDLFDASERGLTEAQKIAQLDTKP